jgi:hypothetical protein
VKETKCGHLFHASCLQEWIKRKIEKPDCPQCRVEIDLLEQIEPPQPEDLSIAAAARSAIYELENNQERHSSDFN